jgi:hypothetical protein
MKWYTKSKPDDRQGLIIDEDTGRNVAVSYDPKDAPLLAAAPRLLAALESVVAIADRNTVEFNEARAAIYEAKGEQ